MKCPWCAETIKAEAKVCRYCGKALDQEASSGFTVLTVMVLGIVGFAAGFTIPWGGWASFGHMNVFMLMISVMSGGVCAIVGALIGTAVVRRS